MTRFLIFFVIAISSRAHAQTARAYDFSGEFDRYENVLTHFEMARIKSIKMKFMTMERPGRIVFDQETSQIAFLWEDLDRNGALMLDRTDILAIEDDPKYPGMYMHIKLANPEKYAKHVFELKRKGPQGYLKFNARSLTEGVLTERLNLTRQRISKMLFQLPARGFDEEVIPQAIKKVAPGDKMSQLRERMPEGTYIEGQEGHALYHVSLVPERNEYLIAESVNGQIYRVSRLLFTRKLEEVDRRYSEFCKAYSKKYGYQIDQNKPVFSLHNGDRVFRIVSYGSRRPMITEGKTFRGKISADRKARYAEPATQIFYMFETDAPGSVEDLSSLVGLDDTKFQNYTSVELIDYGIWAKARGITSRDIANEAISSDDL